MKIPFPRSLNFFAPRCVLATVVLGLLPLTAAGAATDPGCNQLGREVALRASEQMQADLDAAARTELAAIAEAVCLEFTVPMGSVTSAAAASAEAGAAAGDAANDKAGSERREAFGLEIIPPEERVRRPGLKRL